MITCSSANTCIDKQMHSQWMQDEGIIIILCNVTM